MSKFISGLLMLGNLAAAAGTVGGYGSPYPLYQPYSARPSLNGAAPPVSGSRTSFDDLSIGGSKQKNFPERMVCVVQAVRKLMHLESVPSSMLDDLKVTDLSLITGGALGASMGVTRGFRRGMQMAKGPKAVVPGLAVAVAGGVAGAVAGAGTAGIGLKAGRSVGQALNVNKKHETESAFMGAGAAVGIPWGMIHGYEWVKKPAAWWEAYLPFGLKLEGKRRLYAGLAGGAAQGLAAKLAAAQISFLLVAGYQKGRRIENKRWRDQDVYIGPPGQPVQRARIREPEMLPDGSLGLQTEGPLAPTNFYWHPSQPKLLTNVPLGLVPPEALGPAQSIANSENPILPIYLEQARLKKIWLPLRVRAPGAPEGQNPPLILAQVDSLTLNPRTSLLQEIVVHRMDGQPLRLRANEFSYGALGTPPQSNPFANKP